jgi:putative ABC transport system permease protein
MRELSFNPLENPQILYILFSIVVLVGFLAGSYPALCISSFKPIATLRGVVRRGSRNISMRNLLVMLQFSFTIALIFGTIVIKDQLHFIKNKDMGYEKEQILVLHIGDIGTRNNFHKRIDTIKEALRKHPHILAVAGSKRLPNNINFDPINILPVRDSTEKSPTYAVWGDENFVDLYGIKIKEGRNFSKKFSSDRGGAILINETAAKVSKWKSPIGKEITYWGNRKGKIVGVMKDFHFHSLHRPIEALCIYYEPLYFDYLSIKIKPDNLSETINHISKTVKQFSPNHPFEYQFFDEVFERAYITEQRTGTLFNGFALLSIFLACLGLFGYVSFTAVQRTKEVGIRKVLGASVTHITLLFLKQFLIWVLIANFIAWPLAYYVMEKWLHNFVYRATIGLNTFLISSLLALFIAVGTIGYQSIKAAKANPVDSLRFQ